MSDSKITQFDDIVFENRNKDYGAYHLRKTYKKYVTRAIIISTIALFLIAGIPFLVWTQKRSANEEKAVTAEMANLTKPVEDLPPPPPPPPPPEALEQKVRFTAPIVTTDTTVEETNVLNQDNLNQSSTNTAPVDDNVQVEEVVENRVIEQVEAPPVFTIVEEMPSFPGGDESRIKFLQENIKYPQMAKENGISGTVYVTFVVDESGNIIDVKVLRGIGGGCDEEAVRVVKLMPKWNAGKQTGKAVRVQFNMPLRFTLQ